MESVTRRTVLASATGAAAIGLAGQLFGQEKEKSHDADATGRDCPRFTESRIAMLPTLKAAAMGNRAIRSALFLPHWRRSLLNKSSRPRATGKAYPPCRSVSLKELTAAREGQRGVEEGARSIFSGAIAVPFVNIGVVVG